MFPGAKLYNMEGSNSDHSPIMLIPQKGGGGKVKRKFRFENAWLLEPMCQLIVEDSWKEYEQHDIQTKLKICSEKLGVWGKEITGNFGGNIKACKEELKRLRNKRDPQALVEYENVKKRLHLLLDQREIFWGQRSKQLWLKSGDKNSKIFHAAASTRRRTNRIIKLKNSAWEWKEWNAGLEEVVVDYYAELYKAAQVE